MTRRFSLKTLLILPAAVYLAAYIFLAVYHGQWNLTGLVIHEGGTFTFWETTFYASHFLGHIPVHVVVALVLIGVYRCMIGISNPPPGSINQGMICAGLILLLAASTLLSLLHFGLEDTLAYIFQRKQGVDNYVRGGSWNLHLGSTTMMFTLMPVYLYALRIVLGKPVTWHADGIKWLVWAAAILLTFTLIVNGSLLQPLIVAWSDPRYLAHSVRELATFPLTYFPIPLYFLIKSESNPIAGMTDFTHRRLTIAIVVCSLLFAGGFAYQVILPLRIGISDLAQNPDFAGEGGLSVPYLLSSHYFEHFLDTIFFTLLTLLLTNATRRRVA